MQTPDQIRSLIKRLARLDSSQTWEADLNPAQIGALEYLARANRFSRAPSHVADYLGTTRGTMSQTLKALGRKGYVQECRSETDKRSITYDLTQSGRALLDRQSGLAQVIETLPAAQLESLTGGLSSILNKRLNATGGKSFGLCKSCIHHRRNQQGASCALLSVPLEPAEADLICHEQIAA